MGTFSSQLVVGRTRHGPGIRIRGGGLSCGTDPFICDSRNMVSELNSVVDARLEAGSCLVRETTRLVSGVKC